MMSSADGKAKIPMAEGYETWDGHRQAMVASNVEPAAGAYNNPMLEAAPPQEVVPRNCCGSVCESAGNSYVRLEPPGLHSLMTGWFSIIM